MPTTVANIQAVISLQGGDKVQKGLQDVNGEVDKAPSKWDAASASLDKFSGIATKAGGVLSAALTLPIIGLGIAAVKTAMDSQQGLAQTQAVIKSTGGAAGVTTQHVLDLASAQLKLTGIDDDAVEAGENMLLTYKNIGAKGGIFDQATKTALDMATAFNNGVTPSAEQVQQQALQLGKALNDPAKFYTILQRNGVTFTQTEIDQMKTMQAHGNLMGAQKVLLGELGSEFGGSATKSGKTFGGMLEGVKNQAGNLLQALGDKLLPMLMQGLTAITPVVIQVTDAISNMSPVAITVAVAVGGLLAALGPVLLIAGQLAGAISGVVGAFGAEGALAGVTGMLGPIGLVIAGVVALIAAIALVATHWQQISAAIQSNDIFQLLATKIFPAIVTAVQDLGSTIASQVQPILTQLQTTLRTQLLPAWQGLQQAFETAKPVLAVIGAIVGGVLVIALGLLIGVLKGVFSALGPIFIGVIAVFGGIVQVISGVIQTIVGIFQILVGLVKGIFTGDWTTLGDGLNSLKNGVLNILGGLWSAVVGIFQGLVGGVVGLVSGLVSGVVGFFQNLWEKIVGHSIVPDLVNDVLTWINNLVTTFLSFIGGLVVRGIAFFLALGSGILAAVNSMVNLVLSYVDLWISEFVARINLMVSLARAIFNGIISVITSPFITAKNTVLGILDDIKSFFNGLHLQLPHINLPHFSITGNLSINPPSVPHLDIQWYATGGIAGLHGPQIVGVGEREPEAIIPLSALNGGGGGGGQVMEIHIHTDLDGREMAHTMARFNGQEIVSELKRYGIRVG